jgi:hypothetical protein
MSSGPGTDVCVGKDVPGGECRQASSVVMVYLMVQGIVRTYSTSTDALAFLSAWQPDGARQYRRVLAARALHAVQTGAGLSLPSGTPLVLSCVLRENCMSAYSLVPRLQPVPSQLTGRHVMAMCLSGEGQIRTAKPRELHAWTRIDVAPCSAIIRVAHYGASRPPRR